MEYIFSNKEEILFKRYVAIQYSGIYNMITEARSVMDLGEISFNDYCHIQEHYSELKEQYPKTFEDAKKIGIEMNKKVFGE